MTEQCEDDRTQEDGGASTLMKRRGILAAAGVAVAWMVGTQSAGTVRANDGDPLTLGSMLTGAGYNSAEFPTALTYDGAATLSTNNIGDYTAKARTCMPPKSGNEADGDFTSPQCFVGIGTISFSSIPPFVPFTRCILRIRRCRLRPHRSVACASEA